MNNRNIRDTERRKYIKRITEENLNIITGDSESIFAEEYNMENLNNVKIYDSFGKEI